MARRKSDSPTPNGTGADLGFEAKFWLAADKLLNPPLLPKLLSWELSVLVASGTMKAFP